MKIVPLSVRELALPVPRRGSIETLSGYSDAAALGQEIHQRIQKQRLKLSSTYLPEVSIQHEFKTERYTFEVSGRMDGVFSDDIVTIEEIKSAFNVKELKRRLLEGTQDHPYCLQLKTYGYMHWLQTQKIPSLKFHLVSTRHYRTEDFELPFEIPEYEKWLTLRLEELVYETELAEQRVARRKRVAKNMVFPFDQLRSGQRELIETVEKGMSERQRMLIQAPTGLGKTVGVLYPTLREAMSRGQRVVYVTPKNSQHSVAEDAIERLQDAGAKIKSLTITAKSKICLKNEPLCNPEYCEYAKDHYTKVAEHKLPELLSKKKRLTARTFKKLGEEYQVCPFELQLDAAQDVDTVICDYNYAFAPRSAFGRLAANYFAQEGKPNLVIDEAHNMPSRAMDYYSPELSSRVLESMREDIGRLPFQFQSQAMELLNECIRIVLSCQPDDATGPVKIEPSLEIFTDQDSLLREFLSLYLESDVEIQQRDVVLRLCFYWSNFASSMEFVREQNRPEFFMTYRPYPGVVKIICCDASVMLKDSYNDYEHVVGFSATLKPFNYYSRLSGLDDSALKTAEFASPFPRSQRKLLIVPQVSSKYSERARNYPRIADAIHKIVSIKKGNYFAFFPSFDFLERVLENLQPLHGFQVLKQERFMKQQNIQDVLDHLRSQIAPTLVFAVQGGVFSEGVDYPGEMVIGAFVVGTPLPNFDLERETMREYYQEHYESGFDYAYTYPAMSKAIQAAGRVIRSETDRGLIVLMDNRFIEPSFSKSMPQDWFDDTARELVSESILKEVSEFWGV